MRLKVGDTRVAVGVEKTSNSETNVGNRGMLYDIHSDVNKSDDDYTIKQIEKRIADANNRYKVFFRADSIKTLKSHFTEIVKRSYELLSVENKTDKEKVDGLIDVLSNYDGYSYEKDNLKKLCNVSMFSYAPEGKNIKWLMTNYVYEYMEKCWYKKEVLETTVNILMLLCDGKNYRENRENIKKFVQRKDIDKLMLDFGSAVAECNGAPFIRGTFKLENAFEMLVHVIIDKCAGEHRKAYVQNDRKQIEELIKKQIIEISNLECLPQEDKKDTESKISLKDKPVFRCSYIEEERLNAILIRMRKTLKRDTNREIAIELLKALASGDYNASIADLIEKKRTELEHFIDSVNKDYYKFSIIKSVKNMDVKAQVYNKNNDEQREQDKECICALSISNKDKNIGLIQTMEKYVSSQKSSDAMLIEIKKMLYSFFMPNYDAKNDKIFTAEKIWKFPKNNADYFDAGFVCTRKQDEDRKETQCEIKEIWDAKTVDKYNRIHIDQKLLKKRIGYVNVGRYLALVSCQENKANENNTDENNTDENNINENKGVDAVKKYWITYIKDYVEKNYVNAKGKLDKDECLARSMLYACWQSIIKHLSEKFISIGKMVYHIAMPEDMSIKGSEQGGTNYGIVQPAYVNGISSFKYEDISAEDNLQRSIAGATVAAVNNLTRAAFNDKVEDCLLLKNMVSEKEQTIGNSIRENAVKRILRFYGGVSLFNTKDKTDEISLYDEFENDKNAFADELVRLLAIVRNENFHYTDGCVNNEKVVYTKTLLQIDIERYRELVRKRYYTNNVALFYAQEEIKKLVKNLYGHTNTGEAQIPAFQSIWKRKDLPNDFANIAKEIHEASIGNVVNNENEKENKYENEKLFGAIYFVLKEIYYRDFILDNNQNALRKFTGTLAFEYKKIAQKKAKGDFKSLEQLGINSYAESNFKRYIDDHKNDCVSFGSLCQKIMNQYGVQNTNREEEKYKHFKMLLIKYTKLSFIQHLKNNYKWLFKCNSQINKGTDTSNENDSTTFLNDVNDEIKVPFANIISDENADQLVDNKKNFAEDGLYDVYKMAWYTWGHYIHPRQLNLLIGECKNYIQYKNDIAKRAETAGQGFSDSEKLKNENRIAKVRAIIGILEFVKNVSGGITQEADDYYDNLSGENGQGKDEHAQYLSNYISFAEKDKATFEELKNFCLDGNKDIKFDMYVDMENPKILHNIEFARMYAGGEKPLLELDKVNTEYKVTKEEIRKCISQSKEIAVLQNKDRCETDDEQAKIVEYQQLKGRITLNDVTNIYEIVSELLGKLVSLSYLRERDQMYLLLGFYYMMLQGEYVWSKEAEFNTGVIEENINNKRTINCGLVLYQLISVFDFGIKFVNWEKVGDKYTLIQSANYETLSSKLVKKFYPSHEASYLCAMRLFHDDNKHDKGITELRNYVDHLHYYTKRDKSIVELYSEYYTKVFGYSTRLKHSVINNFINILDSNFIDTEMKIQQVENHKSNSPMIEVVLGDKFESKKFDYKLKGDKKVQLPARSEKFVGMLRAVLEYKCN